MSAASLGRPDRPDVAEVTRITRIPNPVIRNLEITHCYSRLATGVAERCGQGANWCTFSTWASRQAGRTIRGEDLLDHLRRELEQSPELLHPVASVWRSLLRRGLFQPNRRLGRLTAQLHTPFDAFERASDAVARGNAKVFEEIGLAFARYLEECPEDEPPDSAEFRAFLDGLREGDPPSGQSYLRRAFTHYQQSRFETDPNVRSELLLLANLEIGLHEQTRLQPEIREALDAPYVTQEDLGRRLLDVLFTPAARWRAFPRRAASAPLDALGSSAQRVAADLAREVITQSFMVLSLPGRVLALRMHLADAFPEALRDLQNAELAAFLVPFEPVAPAVDDCGARDWSELQQRMHYVAHLFRAFHAREDLFRPPFTAAQVKSIGVGVIPEGEL
jgi:hypothetical protein